MQTYIGFDTITVFYNRQTADDINKIIELFYKLGIKNYIIVFDFDPLVDSITIMRYKSENFSKNLRTTISHRVKIKCILNLLLSQGAAFNDSVKRLYANRNSKSLFITLPLFIHKNYEPIAHDVNHLLYKRKDITVFTALEKLIETSDLSFCMKFIENPKISFTIDINYLFNPDKQKLFNSLLTNNVQFLPSVTGNVANYAGILESANNALEIYGKKKYYKLFSQINHSSEILV